MTDAWEWDETLFEGAAMYYDHGRLPYSPALADALARALQLDGTGRLLDVGCGPGSVTLLFADRYAAVVGVDPDRGMLAEAERLTLENGIMTATWVRLRGEDLPAGLGSFRTVTFAASLHWMDRPRVFATVRNMLEPGSGSGGAVVHVDSGHQDLTPPSAFAEVRIRYLGPDRRAGQSIRNSSPGDEDDVFRAAGFAGPERVAAPDGRTIDRSIDDLVAFAFSQSSMAPHLFGDRVTAFEADLRAALTEELPSGVWTVTLPDNELKIWRPTA